MVLTQKITSDQGGGSVDKPGRWTRGGYDLTKAKIAILGVRARGICHWYNPLFESKIQI
jgi:hypothetical protein